MTSGGATYKTCPRNRRQVLNMAALKAPARGRCRFDDSEYVAIPFWVAEPISINSQLMNKGYEGKRDVEEG
jgi:hypothetical protein